MGNGNFDGLVGVQQTNKFFYFGLTCGEVDMVTLVSMLPCLSTAVLLAVPRSGGSQQNLQWEPGLTSLNMSPKIASFRILTEHIKILKYGKHRD